MEENAPILMQPPQLSPIEGYLASVFDDARTWKESESGIQSLLLDCVRRKNGEYAPDKLARIRESGMADQFLPITGMKCRAVESFVLDVYSKQGAKRVWNLKPTPVPDLPDDETARIVEKVMESYRSNEGVSTPEEAYAMASGMRGEIVSESYRAAQDAADRISRWIDDKMAEGGWDDVFAEAIGDLCSMKAMVVKGPVMRKRKVRSGWSGGMPKVETKTVPTFSRVSPLDLYPSRHADSTCFGPLVEKVRLSRGSLAANRKEPGYVTKAIEDVVSAKSVFGVSQDSLGADRKDAETREGLSASGARTVSAGPVVEGLEFWCSVRGDDLLSFGVAKDGKGDPVDPMLDYEINAITVGGKIVFIEFNNDPFGRRPYHVAGFSKEAGGFWYRSPAEILKPVQDIINAATRSMVNNLAICSGPQTVIPDINKLAAGEKIESGRPFKVWQGTGVAQGGKLVDFFQPDSNADEFIKIIESFTRMTDLLLEMPAWSYGSDKVAGAGRTSSGLSMLMASQSKGMGRVVKEIDKKVLRPVVEALCDIAMREMDDAPKGDVVYVSEGVLASMLRDQLSERRMDFLQRTQNEFDMKILGFEGRAKILAQAMEALESDYDDIVPTKEKLSALIRKEAEIEAQNYREMEEKIRQMQEEAVRKVEMETAKLRLEMEKLDLERRRQDLDFKSKDRELSIRASKQSADLMDGLLEEGGPGQGKGVQGAS
jgi:hypothetical protein